MSHVCCLQGYGAIHLKSVVACTLAATSGALWNTCDKVVHMHLADGHHLSHSLELRCLYMLAARINQKFFIVLWNCQWRMLNAACSCSAEIDLESGLQPCALKRLPFTTSDEQATALAELAAHHALRALPGVASCVAVFVHLDSADMQRYLYIATE